MLNFVDALQKTVLRFPPVKNRGANLQRRKKTGTSKSFRISLVSAALITLMLGLVQVAAGQLVISEFRVRGPNGAND